MSILRRAVDCNCFSVGKQSGWCLHERRQPTCLVHKLCKAYLLSTVKHQLLKTAPTPLTTKITMTSISMNQTSRNDGNTVTFRLLRLL